MTGLTVLETDTDATSTRKSAMHPRFTRSRWFRDDRFGMFIHWGAYSVAARGEWVRSEENLTNEQYQGYVDGFQPHDFDADAWAQAAADAGMRYAVLTAKHHDGFCLFDSELTDYSTMHNGLGRDVVAEFLEAFRKRGIRVGLYFSLLDWHHPDYPAFGDRFHPQRADERYRGRAEDFGNYLDYMHAQVRELCTRYGKLDLLWFDFAYDQLRGQAWRAGELMDMVRELQPNALVDNRLETSGEGFGSIVTVEPSAWAGDFVSPEQLIPAEGILDHAGRPVPWEACVTLNNHWGHFDGDHAYKPARMLVRKLVETVSKGGNLLLNVGPDAHGAIDPAAQSILREVGKWLSENGDSVYGCGPADLAKPEWGFYTRKDDTVFAHVLEPPIGPLAITGIDSTAVRRVTHHGREVPIARSWLTEAYESTAFVSFGEGDPAFTYPLPDETDTVLAIELGDPDHDDGGAR
jgi:alpha-L-fucosidase